MYKRILVATDGTKLSKKAVGSAISLAALCGAEVVALKVIPRYPVSYFEGGIALPAEDIQRDDAFFQSGAATIVQAADQVQQQVARPLRTRERTAAQHAGKLGVDFIAVRVHRYPARRLWQAP